MGYRKINLINLIGEFPTWNLSQDTRRNKYLESEELKRRFQRELNVLNYTKCTVRNLSFFARYPLLRKIIPFLQENADIRDIDASLFLEMAILLSYYVRISARSVMGSIHYFLKCRNDLTGNAYSISSAGIDLLDEIASLIREGNLGLISESNTLKACLFKDEVLTDLTPEEIRLNDSIFGYRLQEYISGRLLCIVIDALVDQFCARTPADLPCFTLYSDLCIRGEVNSFIDKEGNLSYGVILSKKDCPLSMCIAFALDKITASSRINSRWLLNHIDPIYLKAFRELWWKCSLYAEYMPRYSGSISLSDGLSSTVESIIGLVELETGEKLTMPDDYPMSGIFSKAMEIEAKSPGGQQGIMLGTPEVQSPPGNVSPKVAGMKDVMEGLSGGISEKPEQQNSLKTKGRPMTPFKDCFYCNDDTTRNKYLEVFKTIAAGGKGKRVGTMIAVAYDMKILKVTPSFAEAQKELGDIGAESGYKRYNKTPDTQGREYEDIKARLLKCKAALEAEQPHPQHFEGPTNNSFK